MRQALRKRGTGDDGNEIKNGGLARDTGSDLRPGTCAPNPEGAGAEEARATLQLRRARGRGLGTPGCGMASALTDVPEGGGILGSTGGWLLEPPSSLRQTPTAD